MKTHKVPVSLIRVRALAGASLALLLLLAASLSLAPLARAQISNLTDNQVISSVDDVVPLSQLTFAATGGTLATAPNVGNIIFDSASTGSNNRLAITTVTAVSFFVDENSTLTFTNNVAPAQNGGAIFMNQGQAKLILNAADSGTYVFDHNTTGANNGGAIAFTGNGAIVNITNALFQNNSAPTGNGGGAFFNSGNATATKSAVTLNNVTFLNNSANQGGGMGDTGAGTANTRVSTSIITALFESNTSTGGNGGGGFFANGNFHDYSLTDVTFNNNSSASTGGAISSPTVNSTTLKLTNVALTSNTAATNGGAIYFADATNWGSAIYTDVSFIKNVATNGQGGAIYQAGGTLAITVNNSSTFAGNTANGNASSIYFTSGAVATEQSVATFTIDGDTTLDMLDPMTAAPASGRTIIMNATGPGVWNLGGMNTLDNTLLTVSTGTLRLYRAGEVDNPTTANPSAKVGAGGINITTTAGSAGFFSLNGAMTLHAGGGNSITAPSITLADGATLDLDLKGVSNTIPLLKLSAPSLSVNWSTINVNLLNSDWLAAQVSTFTASQTYDLISITGDTTHLFTDMPDLAGNFATLTGIDALLPADFILQLDPTGSILQLYYYKEGGLTNYVLNWTGATGSTWFGTGNWQTAGATDEATFQHGDVVNLASVATASAGDTNTITITAPAPATSATVGGIFVSGNQNYEISGDGITADSAASVLGKPSVTGKLILGQAAAADGSIDTSAAAAFSGVLDLTGQGASVNNFMNGVDLYSGALRVSTTDQLGTTLSKLSFLGTTTTGTLIIAGNNSLVFDGASNHLTLGANNFGAIALEDSATMTFSGNNTTTSGGAITLGNANSNLLLAAGNGAQYVFSNNAVTGNGGAIALTAASSTLALNNALFLGNTAGGNGAAIYIGAVNSSITLTDVSFLDNIATGAGAAITAILGTAASVNTININVSPDSLSRFAGNKSASGANPNSIYVNYTTANGTAALAAFNINVGAGGILDMLDPIFVNNPTSVTNGAGAQFLKTGAGVWNLSGSSTFVKFGNNGTYYAGITVNEGELYLYGTKDGTPFTDPASGSTYTPQAASLNFNAPNNAANLKFILSSNATLGIGGGNTINYTTTITNPLTAAAISLMPGSVLDFKFDNATEGATAPAMLTISTPSTLMVQTTNINIITGVTGNATLNPIISLDYAAATPALFVSNTYNLLTLNVAAGAGFDLFGADPTNALNSILNSALFGDTGMTIGELKANGYTAIFGVTDNKTLWVSFDYFTALSKVLNWTGANNALWQNGDWVLTGDPGSPAPFVNGDIVNLLPTTTADITNNTNTITVDAATSATAASILVAGSQNYTIDGATAYGIAADAASGDLAGTGKLILGAQSTPTGKLDTTTAFTGTLDLTKTAGNNFVGGVDIYSGVLLISTTDQLGATLSKLNFLGDTTPGAAPATLQIATGQNITFNSTGTATNRLVIANGKAADFVLEDGATLTFANNKLTNTAGAAINSGNGANLTFEIGAGAKLNFSNNQTTGGNNTGDGGAIQLGTGANLAITAADGGFFLFDSNSIAARGAAIFAYGTNNVTVNSGTFSNNNAGTNGGGIALLSNGTATITNVVFTSNTATVGGAIFGNTGPQILIQSSTFLYNTSTGATANTQGGGAIGIQGNTADTGTITLRDVAFANNNAASAGGAVYLATYNNTLIVERALFDSNTAAVGGGLAISSNATAAYVNATLTDVIFTNNNATTTGGAISIGTAGAPSLTLNVSDGGQSLFAQNTQGAAAAATPNSIYISTTATLNINVGNAGSLDMVDPMAAAANIPVTITKTGPGAWNLGGDNNLNASAATTFAVNTGTLHLYGPTEYATGPDGTQYQVSAPGIGAGKITMTAGAFSLGAGATLSAGGNNTITAAKITLDDNSTLTLDLTGATPAAIDGSGYSILTLSTGATTLASNWKQALNLLNADTLTPNGGDIFNLITLQGGATFGTDATTFNLLTDLTGDGFTLQLNSDSTILQLAYAGALNNSVLTWTGAANDGSWTGAGNWLSSSDPAAKFTKGDIINLADDTVDISIPAPATTDITIDTTTSATIAGMFVSGTANYTITGAAIVADAAIGSLSGSDAATGKLTLGAQATDPDAAILTTADNPAVAYTGTLTLKNDANLFTAGIDILSGELVGNAANLAVGPAATITIAAPGALTFDQADTATYSAQITGAGALNKNGLGALTLDADNTLFTGLATVNAGSLLLANTLGGDIAVNATGILGNTAGAAHVLGNVTLAADGALTAGEAGATAAQTFTIDGALTLNPGAILSYNLFKDADTALLTSDTITAATLDTTALADATRATIAINAPLAGTFDLLHSTAALDTTATNFTTTKNDGTNLSGRTTATYAIDATGFDLLLTIANSNTTLNWTGATNFTWDNTGAANWTGGDDHFLPGDAVTFNTTDAVSTDAQTVTIAENVLAADMTVNNATGTYTITGPGAITTSAAAADTNLAGATGKLTKDGAGSLVFTNTANTFTAGIDLLAGTLTGNAANLNVGPAAAITTSAATTLTFDQADAADYAATITGAGDLVKTGAGNLTLSGTTDYTGATTVNAGALTLTAADQLLHSATITLAAGALNTGSLAQTLNELNGAGAINGTAGGGALTLANATADTTYSGIITGAPITKTGANTLTLTGENADTGLTITTGTVQLGAGTVAGTVAGPIDIAANAALALNHGLGSLIMGNAITGSGLIDKLGAGIVTLTANNSAFTGTTNVAAGALTLDAASALGGDTNLLAGSTLMGTGTLHNLAATGATITIGNLNGTAGELLPITGTLTLNGGNRLNFDLAGANSDHITTADLVRNGTETINIAFESSLSGTYTLLTSAAGLAATDADNLNLLVNGVTNPVGGRTEFDFLAAANNLDLVVITHNISIYWAGTPATTWADSAGNWNTDRGNDGTFHDGDAVTFDDTAAATGARTVAIDTAGVQTVGMTVNATAGSYTFTGGVITTSTNIASTIFTTTDTAAATGALTLAPTNKALVTLSNTGNNFENGIIINGGTLQGTAANLTTGAAAGILNNSALVFDQATAATYATPITGAGLLVKQAAGALTLTNTANTYTGGINVLAGSLILANPTDIGAVNISTAATLDLTNPANIGAAAVNGTLKITDNAAYTIGSALTGAGLLDITTGANNAVTFATAAGGNFTGTVALGASTFDLSGANTAALTKATLQLNTGNTTTVGTGATQTINGLFINGGKLDFNTTIPADLAANGIIAATTLTIGTSGTIQVTIPSGATDIASIGSTLFSQAAGTTIDKLVTATTVNGAANVGSLTLVDQTGAPVGPTTAKTANIAQATGNVAVGTYTYKLTATNGLNVNYALTAVAIDDNKTLDLTPAAGENGAFDALISGNGNLTINATSTTTPAPTVTLGAANTFTGTTTVAAGTLVAGVNNALGAPAAANALVLNAASTFDLNGKTQTLGAVTTAASTTLTLGAGTLTVTNGGHIAGALAGAAASALAINGGNLAIDAANANFAGATTIAAGATATLGNTAALGSAPITDNGALTLNNTADGALANAITGAGALNFNGPGAVAIDHDNALTGPVAVNNGTVTAATPAALGAGDIAIGATNPAATLTYTTPGAITNNITGPGTLKLAGADGVTALTGNNTVANIAILDGANIEANANSLGAPTSNIAITNAAVTLMQTGANLGNITMNGASTLGQAKTLAPGAVLKLNSLNTHGDGATINLNSNIGADTPVIDQINLATPANSGAITIAFNDIGPEPKFSGTAGFAAKFMNAENRGDLSVATPSFAGAGWQNEADVTLGDDGSMTFTQGARTGGAKNIIAAATGAMPLTWLTELDTLSKRLGDLQIDPREKPGMDLWARAYAQRINVNDKDAHEPFHETQYGTEVGVDYGGRPTGYGAATYVGAFVGYGGSSRDVNNVNGSGNMNSVYGGLYATFITPDGWYADLVGKYNYFKSTFTADTDGGSFSNDAFGASIEAGKRIELGGNWSVTPNAQASIVRVYGQDYTTNAGRAVGMEQTTSRQVRAGAQAGYKIVTKAGQIWQPYAKAYVAQQWTDGGLVNVVGSSEPYTSAIKGARVDLGLGVNWQVLKSLQVYLDYECSFAKDYTKPYGLALGANYAW